MYTFTQINTLAIQCQNIVVEYNKDAEKYGIDKAELKSTEYYELLIKAMLSAGATINDIKTNHVQIALGKFDGEEKSDEQIISQAKDQEFTFDSFQGATLYYTCGDVLATLTCKYGQWSNVGKIEAIETLERLAKKGVIIELSIIK